MISSPLFFLGSSSVHLASPNQHPQLHPTPTHAHTHTHTHTHTLLARHTSLEATRLQCSSCHRAHCFPPSSPTMNLPLIYCTRRHTVDTTLQMDSANLV